MKILVIASVELQQDWSHSLQKQGWEVIAYAKATEAKLREYDVAIIHRELCGLLPEEMIRWSRKLKNRPWVLVSRVWGEEDFEKHRNSDAAASVYMSESSATHQLRSVLEGFESGAPKKTNGFELEDFSEVLTRPDIRRPVQTESVISSVKLHSPTIHFEGRSKSGDAHENSALIEVPQVIEAAPAVEAAQVVEPQKIIEAEKVVAMDHTTAIQMTRQIQAEEFLSQSTAATIETELPEAVEMVSVQKVSGGESVSVRSVSNPDFQSLEALLAAERARNAELQHMLQRLEHKLKNYDLEKQVEHEVLVKQNEDLDAQLKEKNDKIRNIEARLHRAVEEVDRIKDRVRIDIRKIRVREKELESQLEVVKKDSAALISARDEKILELKRKLDLLEFNMELVQEQFQKERNASDQLRQRLKDAAVAMRQAGGFLSQDS